MNTQGRPSKHPRSPLGEAIAQARESAGLSQTELADLVNVPQQVIASWERKSQTIRSDNLVKLSKALDISTDELLGLSSSSVAKTSRKVKAVISSLNTLPKKQQDQILDVVQAFVEQKS